MACCCGDRDRTDDLKVMSLASYQLLHPAMFVFAVLSGLFPDCECKVTTILGDEQVYD